MTASQLRKILKPLGYSLHRGDYGWFLRDKSKCDSIVMTFDSLADVENWGKNFHG